MKTIIRFKHKLALFVVFLFFLNLIPTSYGKTPPPMTVKVGVFDYDSFYGTDASGATYGYGYEYLTALQKYGNFTYEYYYGSWSDCVTMLENGEIDLLNSAQLTPDRAAIFEFSKYSTGTSYGKVFTRLDNDKIIYNDFSAMDGMKVGMIMGNSRNASFKEYALNNGFETVDVMFNTSDELSEALQAGLIDAGVSSNLRQESNEKLIARFAPSPFYIAMPKNKPELYDRINSALEQVFIENLNFNANLSMKYYPSDYTALILTKDEQDFLKSSDRLNVVYTDRAPFESFDNETQLPFGVNIDIMNTSAKKAGLDVDFIHIPTYEDAVAYLSQGKADIMLGCNPNIQLNEGSGVTLSDIYLDTPISIIGSGFSVTESSIFALSAADIASISYVKETFPSNKIITFDSREACYKAINMGQADFTLDNIYSSTSLIQSGSYGSLRVALATPIMESFSFAFSKNTSPILINVFNKIILTITVAEENSILQTHTAAMSSRSKLEFLQKYKAQAAVAIVISSVLLISSLVFTIFLQKKNKHKLWEMAYIDSKTGVGNLSKFEVDAQRLVTQNPTLSYAILRIDIENFKLINTMYGFAKGDEIISSTIDIIRDMLSPQTDCFARISGDNFIVLKSIGKEQFRHVGTDIETKIQRLMGSQMRYLINFRLGRYLIQQTDKDIISAIEKANYAHSWAKNHGSKNLCDYDDNMRAHDVSEKVLENRMEEAMATQEFLLYLQPKYRLCDEVCVGAEALVRWQCDDDDTDLMYPGTFIPLFEKNGFIIKLDMYMLRATCKTIAEWIKDGIEPVVVSVNFSRLHLAEPNFVDSICKIADEYSIPHHLLEIELTESTIFNNEEALTDILNRIHQEGFTLSMDDFGTGYSSLGLLKSIPIDVIKIDRSFFTSATDSQRANTVLSHVIAMAKDMKIQTVAEGVELLEHIKLLKALNCDIVQGFYYSRAISVKDFTEKIK